MQFNSCENLVLNGFFQSIGIDLFLESLFIHSSAKKIGDKIVAIFDLANRIEKKMKKMKINEKK